MHVGEDDDGPVFACRYGHELHGDQRPAATCNKEDAHEPHAYVSGGIVTGKGVVPRELQCAGVPAGR